MTLIGNYAFFGCSKLSQVTIPRSVNWVGDYAFSGCSSLAMKEIPSFVSNVGKNVFFPFDKKIECCFQ